MQASLHEEEVLMAEMTSQPLSTFLPILNMGRVMLDRMSPVLSVVFQEEQLETA